MFCTHCGTQVADTDKFCPECGAPIERPAAPEGAALQSPSVTAPLTQGSQAFAPTYTPAPAPKKKSHTALWITLICIALALALAAIVIFVWRPWSRCGARENPAIEPTNAPTATAVPSAELTPEEAVRAAFERLNETDSMHLDFVEDVSMTIGVPALNYTQDMDISVVLGCDSDKANGTSRIEGSFSAMGFAQEVLAYAETVDGKMVTYTSNDGGMTWTLQDREDESDNSVLSDPTASIDVWMKHAKDFTEIGTEQVNGFDATVYAGKLSGEYLKDAAGLTGGIFGTLDEAMLNNLDDLPITFWIENEGGRVVRMEIDMQDMMKTLIENALQESMGELPEDVELSVDVSKAIVACDLSQFNEIPPIVIPDEAKGNGTAPAPEPESESIVGTWTLSGGEDEETQQYVDLMVGFGMSMEFEFNEDGTGSMTMTYQGEENREEFTYTLENGEIVIDGQGAPYRIEDGLLHLTADDTKLIFKRK